MQRITMLLSILLSLTAEAQYKVDVLIADINFDYYACKYKEKDIHPVDELKSRSLVEEVLDKQLKTYFNYELIKFDATIKGKSNEDTVSNYFDRAQFKYIQCYFQIRINEAFNYASHIVLDTSYRVLEIPERFSEQNLSQFAKLKPYTAYSAEIVKNEVQKIKEIYKIDLFEREGGFFYKIEDRPKNRRYNSRSVFGKYWKEHEQKNAYILINAITGEIIEGGFEKQTYQVNSPF